MGLAAVFRGVGHAFGAHDLHLVDAQESKELPQVGLLEIRGRLVVNPAAPAGDDDPLAPGKVFGPCSV